jgi:EAL domain-containing protein (putative c-di-GMP-specific phosphodiesterase class I)
MRMEHICSRRRDGVDFEVPFAVALLPIVDVESRRAVAYEALVRGVGGTGAYQICSNVNESNRYSFDQACRVNAIGTAMAAGLMQSDAKLSINFLPNAVKGAYASAKWRGIAENGIAAIVAL